MAHGPLSPLGRRQAARILANKALEGAQKMDGGRGSQGWMRHLETSGDFCSAANLQQKIWERRQDICYTKLQDIGHVCEIDICMYGHQLRKSYHTSLLLLVVYRS